MIHTSFVGKWPTLSSSTKINISPIDGIKPLSVNKWHRFPWEYVKFPTLIFVGVSRIFSITTGPSPKSIKPVGGKIQTSKSIKQ